MNALFRTGYRSVNFTVIATFFFVGNQFLFAFTKNPIQSEVNNEAWVTSPIFLFLTSWLFFAAVGLILCLACITIAYPLYRRWPTTRMQGLPYVVPGLYVALTVLSVADNFTITSFGFSSITHTGAFDLLMNRAYLAGFLITVFIFTALCLDKARSLEGRDPWKFPANLLVIVTTFTLLAFGALNAWSSYSQPRASDDAVASIPNVFVLTLESASADTSSAYGDLAYDTTPFLRRFATEAVRADNYFSNGYNSRESINTIISGLHPFQHEGYYPTDIIPETVSEMNLPNLLRRYGYPYELLHVPGPALSEYDENFAVKPLPPMFREFQEETFTIMSIVETYMQRFARMIFDAGWPNPFPGVTGAKAVIEQAKAKHHPFFIHIHAMQSHGDYYSCPSDEINQLSALLPTLKRQEVCYLVKLGWADKYASSFYDLLSSENVLDNTVFVIVGDHAVPFPYTTESTDIFRYMLRIPLLIRLPHAERAGDVIHANTQGIDVLPTILDALHLPPAPWGNGTSILQPDFDTKYRTRAIFIDDGYKPAFDIIVCDWLRYTNRSNRDVKREDWQKTSYVRSHCSDAEFPPIEQIIQEVHDVQWIKDKYP